MLPTQRQTQLDLVTTGASNSWATYSWRKKGKKELAWMSNA